MGMYIPVLRMLLWKQVKIHIFLENSRRDNFVNFGQFVSITLLVSMEWIILHLSTLCTPSVLCWIEKCSQIWQLQILKFLLKSLISLNSFLRKQKISLKIERFFNFWNYFLFVLIGSIVQRVLLNIHFSGLSFPDWIITRFHHITSIVSFSEHVWNPSSFLAQSPSFGIMSFVCSEHLLPAFGSKIVVISSWVWACTQDARESHIAVMRVGRISFWRFISNV